MAVKSKAMAGIAVAGLLGLSGCQEERSLPSRHTISVLHYFSGSLSGGVDDMVETFNAAHPSLHVSATGLDHEAFKTRIGEALGQPNPPELFSYWAGARTQALLTSLSPIDDIWKSANLDAQFAPSLVRSASEYGGSRYLLPITQHLVGFFYNKKLLSDLKRNEPRTWAEFQDLCSAAKAAGLLPVALGASARWPAQFWFDYLLVRTAGSSFRDRLVAGKERFSSPEVVHAFTLWKQALEEGWMDVAAPDQSWDTEAALAVKNGSALMTLMGTWLIGYYRGAEVGWPEDEIGFFAFPEVTPGVPRAAIGPIDGLILAKEALDPYGAKEVIRYLAEQGPQEAFSAGSGALSPNTSVPDSFYSPLQLEAKAEVTAAADWVFAWDLAATPAAAEIGLNLFADFLRHPQNLTALLAEADKAMAAIESPSR